MGLERVPVFGIRLVLPFHRGREGIRIGHVGKLGDFELIRDAVAVVADGLDRLGGRGHGGGPFLAGRTAHLAVEGVDVGGERPLPEHDRIAGLAGHDVLGPAKKWRDIHERLRTVVFRPLRHGRAQRTGRSLEQPVVVASLAGGRRAGQFHSRFLGPFSGSRGLFPLNAGFRLLHRRGRGCRRFFEMVGVVIPSTAAESQQQDHPADSTSSGRFDHRGGSPWTADCRRTRHAGPR